MSVELVLRCVEDDKIMVTIRSPEETSGPITVALLRVGDSSAFVDLVELAGALDVMYRWPHMMD